MEYSNLLIAQAHNFLLGLNEFNELLNKASEQGLEHKILSSGLNGSNHFLGIVGLNETPQGFEKVFDRSEFINLADPHPSLLKSLFSLNDSSEVKDLYVATSDSMIELILLANSTLNSGKADIVDFKTNNGEAGALLFISAEPGYSPATSEYVIVQKIEKLNKGLKEFLF